MRCLLNYQFRREGVTLIEVLAAILISGIGLLALLTLFPLGALSMAQAIKEDRAAAVAADAATFSTAGQQLLDRTGQFVWVSFLSGSADSTTAANLREKYEELALEAAGLESRIEGLRPLATTRKAKRLVNKVLAEIRTIKSVLDYMAELLHQLELGPQ